MVLHSLSSDFGEMLYYRRRSHIYGRKGKFKVVIFMEIRSHSYNEYTQFMVLHSLASGFGEMLYYRRRSHTYGRKGKFKVVIFMELYRRH